jgi:hypothetical protein
LRKKQLELFEYLTMLEQRILCHKLPKSFDDINIDTNEEQNANKRNKTIQELKRRMLHVELEQYENKIQYYEHLYQQDLTTLLLQISNPNPSYPKYQVDTLLHFVKLYLNHYTNRFLRQIRYKESCVHRKLLRHYRHRLLSRKKTIDVYPQIIVDVPKVCLNRVQLDYLSRNGKLEILLNVYLVYYILFHEGPNYIRPNQSYLHSYEHRQKQVKEEHKNITNAVTSHLVRVHHMSHTSTIIKQFSRQLETCLYERYMAPLSYLNIYRTRKERKLIELIRNRLKKSKQILRVTDKSGIFHIGHAKDYEQKAEAYRQKTGAYIELTNDPLWIVFDKVVYLLNDLRSKDQIRAWQLNKMMPKRDNVQLAYLYFIPKPHKVSKFEVIFCRITIHFVFLIGRNTIKTNCLIDGYTNNWHFQVFRSITSTLI